MKTNTLPNVSKRKIRLKIVSNFTENPLIEHKLEDNGYVEFFIIRFF